MANIKKSFNFRNGVQVDDDNLKVSTTGLVGIGTTVPTEALDVRGNLVVSGVSSATTAQAGVLTVTTFNPTEIIGAGVSIKSGIITASSGIVTFYGDGINLLNLPTSQWEDTIIGAGVSSIYNTGGNVGIATTAALFTLQVGNDVNSGQKGVGISSFGDIKASGIITATTFVGNLTGSVTGNIVGVAASATQLATARTIGGVSFDGTSNIDLAGVNIAGNQNTSGTAANLSGTPNLLINNLSAAGISTLGVSTFTSTVNFGGSVSFGDNDFLKFGNNDDLQIYHSTASGGNSVISDTGTGNLIIGGSIIEFKNATLSQTHAAFFEGQQVDLYYGNAKKFSTSGIGVTVYNQLDATNIVASGIVTSTTNVSNFRVGVGTNQPANEIQVRKTNNAEIQVTSDTGVAGLTVGRESGTGNTNNAEFRYGGGAGANYSSAQSLDILNYGTGNFNYHLSANNAGAVAGDFHWHKGLNNAGLMTLTGIGGSLGIGITTPSTPLHVLGAATISGSLNVGNNLIVSGTLNSNVSGNVTGNLTGNVNGNANAAAGISTFNNLSVSGIATITNVRSNSIGIGTNPSLPLTINSNPTSRFFVNANGNVGIKTTDAQGMNFMVAGSSVHQILGVGTTIPISSVDFSLAGQAITGPFANKMFMIPPKVSGTGTLAGVVSGALVYNTSTNTIQVYNGSSWGSLGSGGGGGEANQFAFSNIAVAGQSTVAADSTTDTLTLVAGSNVTLTTNAGNDSVTIAASGGGGGGISNVVEDTTPQLGGNLDVQTNEITTSTSNGNIKLNPNGTGVVEVKGDGSSADGTIQLNCSQNSHGIKLKSPPHSASASYTLTFPNSIVNGQFLKTDASGNLSWDSRLGAGFVNAADYGLDASATDGTNVTAINNAVTALGTNGGTIFFPGGMFYLNAAITLGNSNNSIRFVGSGHQNYGGGSDAGGTVLRRDADDEFFNITNSRAIHFVGITFKGGAANGSGGDSGISGGNGAIYVVANAGCQGYLIENCVFHGIANSIHFKGLSDSIIRGCRFRNVPSNEGAGACIKLDENGSEVIDQIRIQDCVLDGSPDGSGLNANVDGIAIYNTVSTVYITNTSAIRLKRSFYSDSSWDGNFFYFQNSEAERASSDGFSINGTGNFVTIDNCFSSTNNGHGINIGSSQNSSLNITNPNVRDNSGHGILIDGPTNNCSIVNPAIGGNSRGSSGTNHGIVIGSSANNVYITGGKIGGNTDELAGTGTQGYGIQINGGTHSNIRIIGTNVTGNATNSSEGITQSISSGTGNSIQFNAGSTTAIDT